MAILVLIAIVLYNPFMDAKIVILFQTTKKAPLFFAPHPSAPALRALRNRQ
jgi:hypothetical protein